jgi:O-acetyl-ADP-ribose deacetylase (regulator of RNase III)
LDQALAAIGGLAVGEAIVTPGFAASARLIVHTVAPIWFAPGPAEEKDRLLARCYAQSIAAALRAGAASLAFPALGTGFFGWPKPRAAAIATAAARTAAGSAIAITFCCFTEEDRLIYAPLVSG